MDCENRGVPAPNEQHLLDLQKWTASTRFGGFYPPDAGEWQHMQDIQYEVHLVPKHPRTVGASPR